MSECPTCKSQARSFPCPDCGPSLAARRAASQRELLAYALRGFMASGLVPVGDSGAGPWETLDESQRTAWRALAAQTLYSVEALQRMSDSGRIPEAIAGPEPAIVWLGNAQLFAETVAGILDVEQLAMVAGEMAIAWRNKRIAFEKAVAAHGTNCDARRGRPCDCGLVFR